MSFNTLNPKIAVNGDTNNNGTRKRKLHLRVNFLFLAPLLFIGPFTAFCDSEF